MATPPNPLMQQAAGMFSNPNAMAIPPQPQGVIDPTQHPVIKAIIQALSQAGQSYSMTAMDPRERMQRQEMDAQKAEALARLGISQQQLGLEGQRVGIEQQRANTEARGVAQTGAYQTGELGIRGREAATSEAAQRTSQQRADQEHEARLAQHELASKTLEEDIRYHRAETKTAEGRLAVERRANELAGSRIDMEKEHFESQVALQGKQYTRQLAEDERKQLHTSLDGYYKEHPWIANLTGTGAGSLQQKHKDIDDYIDKKIGVAGAYSGWRPSQGVLAAPGGNDTVTVISNGVRGSMPRANLAEAQKRDPKLQVIQ